MCAEPARGEHSSGRPTNASPSQVDEEVLLNAERLVSGFEIARTVALEAMEEHQILSASQGAGGPSPLIFPMPLWHARDRLL
jgi:hypothetical protein